MEFSAPGLPTAKSGHPPLPSHGPPSQPEVSAGHLVAVQGGINLDRITSLCCADCSCKYLHSVSPSACDAALSLAWSCPGVHLVSLLGSSMVMLSSKTSRDREGSVATGVLLAKLKTRPRDVFVPEAMIPQGAMLLCTSQAHNLSWIRVGVWCNDSRACGLCACAHATSGLVHPKLRSTTKL